MLQLKQTIAKDRQAGTDARSRLVCGDNLELMRSLSEESCDLVYIDPPFNTGQAFQHYDDGVEHSLWLSLMHDRVEILRRLLHPEGTLWLHLDDNEAHYMQKILGSDLHS